MGCSSFTLLDTYTYMAFRCHEYYDTCVQNCHLKATSCCLVRCQRYPRPTMTQEQGLQPAVLLEYFPNDSYNISRQRVHTVCQGVFSLLNGVPLFLFSSWKFVCGLLLGVFQQWCIATGTKVVYASSFLEYPGACWHHSKMCMRYVVLQEGGSAEEGGNS